MMNSVCILKIVLRKVTDKLDMVERLRKREIRVNTSVFGYSI